MKSLFRRAALTAFLGVFGIPASADTNWSEDFIHKVQAANDFLLLYECQVEDEEKDIFLISVTRQAVDFLRVEDHALLVTTGEFSIKDGELTDPNFMVPAGAQKWFADNARHMVETKKFSVIFPKNAGSILAGTPTDRCNYPE